MGNHVRACARLTNRTSIRLASEIDRAATHAIVYADAKVGSTHRFARVVAIVDIISLRHGTVATCILETSNLAEGVDSDKPHVVVLANDRPGGAPEPYDLIHAAIASQEDRAYLPHVARW